MVFLMYDAKHKDTLPYWDAMPIVLPFRKLDDGFIGLNLHYIPPAMRAQLMNFLYENLTNTKFDKSTRIKFDYAFLKASSKNKYYQPCVKRYLYSHMKSRFFLVQPEEWQISLFLPLAKWQKRSAQDVYQDSRRIIKG